MNDGETEEGFRKALVFHDVGKYTDYISQGESERLTVGRNQCESNWGVF